MTLIVTPWSRAVVARTSVGGGKAHVGLRVAKQGHASVGDVGSDEVGGWAVGSGMPAMLAAT